MQNSVTMGLRAIVLLICLVGVPLFAVFGKNAPDAVKALIRNLVVGPTANESNHRNASDDTSFRPGLAAAQGQAPDKPLSATADDTTGSGLRALVPVADVPANQATRTIDAQQQAASQLTQHVPAVSGPVVRTVGTFADRREAAVAAASHIGANRANAMTPPDQQPANVSFSTNSDLPGFPADYFRGAEQKLRQLGATYYVLETLGPAGDSYRFFCKVAVSQNPDQVLAFFATNPDPLAAMGDVVRQVEMWRAHLRQ
jgi:hypothetical protein